MIATEDFQTKMAIHVSSVNANGKNASSSSSSSSSCPSSSSSHTGKLFPSPSSSTTSSYGKDGGTPHRDSESSRSPCNTNRHNQDDPDHRKTDLSSGKENIGNSKAGGEVEGKGSGVGVEERESEEDVYKKAMRPLQYDETSELSKYHYK